jgi:Family of unknown function (DUF5309)
MAVRGISTFNSFVSETSNVRDVSTRLLNLEPDRTPLYVLTNNSKRKVSVFTPRIEFFEDADLVMLGQSNGALVAGATATAVGVADSTIFGVGDVVAVQKTSEGTATVEELIQVTAVSNSGGASGTLTVTRGFALTPIDVISATATLKILGVAQSEVGAIANPRTPVKSPKTSGAQIFEWPMQISRTAAATKIYGDRPERARIQWLGMRRQKLEIENSGLFGSYSETLNGTASMYTSMGVRSIISSWIADAGGTQTPTTLKVFLDWSRMAFRYGSPEKLLMAAPLVKEAMDYWAAGKQFVRAEDKVFGVSLKRFVTSNGNWLIANNYNMDGGVADEALGIDLPSIEYCPLVNNGQNLDTRLYPDYDPTNPKLLKDLILTQAGWRIWHQARHARIYDFQAFA